MKIRRMDITRCIVPALLMAILPFANAQAADDTQVWQGTLGQQAIVMKRDDGRCGGRYFYRRHRIDITLMGDDKAARCTLQEMPPRWSDDTPKPEWRMQSPQGERWQGEWVGVDGKRLPIALTRLRALPAAKEASLTALRGDFDPYAYLRLSALALKPAKRETVNGYALQWRSQPDSGIELFDVAAGYTPEARARINHLLHRRLWEWVNAAFECRSGHGAEGSDFDTRTTLRHIDTRVLSASLFTSYYCGGAHPDFGDAPLNIDVRTGRELDLEDVLWVGKGKPLHDGPGDEWNAAWADYRGEVFAPWVVRQLARRYPAEMAAPRDEGSCDYRDPEVWKFPAWYVTPKGIHLAASFARVARACDDPDWAVLPWPVVDTHRGAVRLH